MKQLPLNSRRLLLCAAGVLALSAPGGCSKDKDKHGSSHKHADEATSGPKPDSHEDHASGAHGDHEHEGGHVDKPQHGGLVLQDGDLHSEVVIDPKTGKHEVFFTDKAGAALPASAATGVAISVRREGKKPEVLAPKPSPAGTSWVAMGTPIDDPRAVSRLAYNYGGKASEMEVPMPLPGADRTTAQGTEKSHGGITQKTSGGSMELLATDEGSFKIWLLGDGGRLRPAAGATGTVRVAVPKYPKITLDVVGDHLEGQGTEIKASHAVAAVSVKVGGKAETARFKLHLEDHEDGDGDHGKDDGHTDHKH